MIAWHSAIGIDLSNGKALCIPCADQEDEDTIMRAVVCAMKGGHDGRTVTLPGIGTVNGRHIVRVWSEPYLPREGQA